MVEPDICLKNASEMEEMKSATCQWFTRERERESGKGGNNSYRH
jgi:hypothetical protein